MSQPGHLFVIRGDLTRVAADAFVVPCDSQGRVAGTWRPFVDPGRSAQPAGEWFTVPEVDLVDGVAVLPDPEPGAANPDEVVGVRVLVDTVGVADIPHMVERALLAVRMAASARPHGGRALPLVAMTILGVGQGAFWGRRAEVVRELVGQLCDFVATEPVDVVLCLRRATDFAAVEWERARLEVEGWAFWPSLAPKLIELADDLGRRAARRELSIFIGAGVSKPVGLPDWKELLQSLSDEQLDFEAADYPALAEGLASKVPDLNERVAEQLTTRRHALGHALLAGLRTQASVTTNYDPCFENAAMAIHTDPPLRVITRQLAVGGSPWLLKMHGDVKSPGTIVLSRSQYDELERDRGAVRGIVQSLMLTSHLLFVGFGFADDDFLAMAQAVQRVRRLADMADEEPYVGTALSLAPPSVGKYAELLYAHLRDDGDVALAARDLEIFLDRMAATCQVEGFGRASYLLDPEYRSDASPADRALADALGRLQGGASQWRGSSGAALVDALLTELGGVPHSG